MFLALRFNTFFNCKETL